jgi:hypothetical protein
MSNNDANVNSNSLEAARKLQTYVDFWGVKPTTMLNADAIIKIFESAGVKNQMQGYDDPAAVVASTGDD